MPDINQTCHQFLWKTKQWVSSQAVEENKATCMFGDMIYIFDSLSGTFPPFFSCNLEDVVFIKQFHHKWYFHKQQIQSTATKGVIVVIEVGRIFQSKSDNIVLCQPNIFISSIRICDCLPDCDENFLSNFQVVCLHLKSSNKPQKYHKTHKNISKHPKCPEILSINIDGSCQLLLLQEKATHNKSLLHLSQDYPALSIDIWSHSISCNDQGLIQCSEQREVCFAVLYIFTMTTP